jgi:tetratricopeptide (TPR) repeat protein
MLRWAVELTAQIDDTVATDREPDADAILRRELGNLRGAWHLARRQNSLDDAIAIVVALYDSAGWRELTELWGWSEELAADPRLAQHPRAAEVLGVAAEFVAYLRGDYARADQLAREGLALATGTAGSVLCLGSLAVAALTRGAYADAIERALAVAALARRPSLAFAWAALAATHAGDLDQARALNARMAATATSPTLRGFSAYVDGEIAIAAGDPKVAESHYLRAIAAGRGSGATYLVGIASVGLVTALVQTGSAKDALHGYRDVIEYWAATGNWTHQWITLRSLADLLRALGDDEPAALIEAAADQAPDVPAWAATASARPRGTVPGRAALLDLARRAIERNLSRP